MIMKVAVIILNYNSSEDYRKCVPFLKRQVLGANGVLQNSSCKRWEQRVSKFLLLRRAYSIASGRDGGPADVLFGRCPSYPSAYSFYQGRSCKEHSALEKITTLFCKSL